MTLSWLRLIHWVRQPPAVLKLAMLKSLLMTMPFFGTLTLPRGAWREKRIHREAAARKQKFSYAPGGDIGVVGNGAGLVMATVDMIHVLRRQTR